MAVVADIAGSKKAEMLSWFSSVTIIGNLEARNLPVLIAANKIDAENASPATLKSAFPQHPVIPISALTGYNTENLYSTMIKEFSKKHKKRGSR